MASFHIWFATKRRKPALVEVTRDIVLRAFTEIAERADIDLIEAEAQFDHVHLLLRVKPDQKLSELMRRLKGGASREVFVRNPDMRYDFGQYFWQRGYGFRLVPEDQVEAVRHYIQTQDERPLRHGQ